MNKTVIMNHVQKSSHRWFSCDAPKTGQENTVSPYNEINIG